VGILLGLGTSEILARTAGWPTQVPIIAIFLSFGFSGLIGVVFGLYPAWKAAGLDPIDALRYE